MQKSKVIQLLSVISVSIRIKAAFNLHYKYFFSKHDLIKLRNPQLILHLKLLFSLSKLILPDFVPPLLLTE